MFERPNVLNFTIYILVKDLLEDVIQVCYHLSIVTAALLCH